MTSLTEDYRRREESITISSEPAGQGQTQELMTLNIGPHHPSTHGVLRLLATIEGEVIRDIKPIIGYVHTGIEKTAEDKAYWKVIPVVERMDYVSYYFNAMAFCGAVETLLGVEVPPRAQYLRVIHLELNRIASHLVWLGTSALDLGAISMFWYCFREREKVLDLFEMSSGQRMHTRYIQVGGVMEDIPAGFARKVQRFVSEMPGRADEYADMLSRNQIVLERLRGTGAVDEQTMLSLGVTGPLLRACGNPWDLRKAQPYSSYDHFDFKIPVGTVGDNYDRYRVRHAELYESTKIIQQALDGLPEGPFITTDRKVALPPRHELATSMEALIHHFKLVTEGFRVPPGEAYYPIEGPRGELGCFVRADGSAKPARVHMRDPSFVNLQALAPMVRDEYIADLIATLAMLDPILGGIDRVSSIEHPHVPRFAHGSRVPGWDEAVDLNKDPAVIPDQATTPVPDELRQVIERAMAKYPDRHSAVIPALHAAQEVHGWCSPEAIDQVAAVMQVTPAYLTSVATFYDMLETEAHPGGAGANQERPSHHDIYVCTNISCSLRGADELYGAMIAAAAQRPDVHVRAFECLGACDIAPMASVDGEYVGPLDPPDAAEIMADLAEGRPVLPEKQLLHRRCADPGVTEEGEGPVKLLFDRIDEPGLNTLAVYERRGGYQELRKALAMPPEDVLQSISDSGLRGRGGAGFRMGQKVGFLPHGHTDKYLVCNADESEPGTFKDRELMQKNPHQLIEGLIIASWAAEIDRAFIYIRGEYEQEAEILEAAIAEAEQAGYLGRRILGSEHSVSLVLHRGAGAYICGEETGLLDSLEGKRGNPRLKPPFPAIEGLYHGPTLINNVETLSTVPHIIRMGGSEYAKIGTETSTGTKLVSVSGDVQRPGNYEIELGASSRHLIYDLAGGPPEGREVKFWFPGGSSAPVLTKDDLDLAYDFDTMAKAGSMLGSGAIIVVDDSHTVLEVALKLAKFYAHESCGKCVPCREGTNWTVKMLQRIQAGEATPMDLDLMASVQTQIIGNCLCVLGDAMAMPIGSMVEKFRDELEAEIESARQRAEEAAMFPLAVGG